MGRANTCQDQPKKMARDANGLRVALGILKGIALLREREIYHREIRVTVAYRARKLPSSKARLARERMARGIRTGERCFLSSL